MAKKTINIGTDPGNQGDGDTLRAAFEKTQANFDELYVAQFVNNPDLPDHGNANVAGTIASALAVAEANGGGTVHIGPGVYKCYSTLVLSQYTRLVGAGRGVTIISVKHLSQGVTSASGNLGVPSRSGVEHITIDLHPLSASSAIGTAARQAGADHIQNVELLGGGPGSWGITLDSANQFTVLGVVYEGGGSGIRVTNAENWSSNYGDGLLTNIDITLSNPNMIGVLLEGNTMGVVNNVLLNRIEVKSLGFLVGAVGIEMLNVSRITLVNVDVENCETGFMNGPRSKWCSFFNAYAIGCDHDYVEEAPAQQVTIIGGYGDFVDNQQLPSAGLKLYEASFDQHVSVVTGLRQIEEYTDTVVPRKLDLPDSGSKVFTNKGAQGPVLFVLPNAANSKSEQFSFSVRTGQELRIIPDNARDRILGYDGSTKYTPSGFYIYANKPGATITLHNIDNVFWVVDSRIGDWLVGT